MLRFSIVISSGADTVARGLVKAELRRLRGRLEEEEEEEEIDDMELSRVYCTLPATPQVKPSG